MAASLGNIGTELSHLVRSQSQDGVLMDSAARVLRFADDERGQDLIEWALLLGFIGLALLGSGIHFATTRGLAKNQAGIGGS